MIDALAFFKKMNGAAAPFCTRDSDVGDLVRASQIAIESSARRISVDAGAVETVWPWLENTNIKICARFTPVTGGAPDARISDLARRITSAFKQGATCAQIFIRAANLNAFVDAIAPIRDDLFFNRELSVALDIGECNTLDWESVFDALVRVRADSLLMTLTRDDGDKSDFVGRIYSMLGACGAYHGALHFALGQNLSRIEQVVRLTRAMRPDALAHQIFFVNN